MPFQISQKGYGAADNLGALVGSDFAKYKTPNPLGLQDYVPEGFGDVGIGGGQYNVRWDPTTSNYILFDKSNPNLGQYSYGEDGKLSNWSPYNDGNTKADFGAFLASALTMGASGVLGAAAEGAAGGGTVGGSTLGGGLLGDATAAGYGGLDAASTATMGGGAAGGGSLGVGGTGAMGAAGGGLVEGAAPAFNAAADSQLANVAIDSAGGNALSAYTGSAIAPAVTSASSAPWYQQLAQAAADKVASTSAGDIASAAIKYGAPLLGSAISANGAKSAAETQAAATDRANALLTTQYNTTRGDLAPWRDSGVKANNALVSAMGLGPNDGSAGYGSLTKPFTGADLASEPGYQFGLNQGQRQIDQRAASGGSYFSGNALKAAAKYGNDYAGTKYGEAFNRDQTTKGQQYGFLSGMSTQGQNAANMTGQFGSNTTGQIAGNTTALGNAQGASQIAQGNALQGALGSVTNSYNQDNMLQQILANQQRQQQITGGNTNGLR